VLTLLHQRLATAKDAIAVDRDSATLVVRSLASRRSDARAPRRFDGDRTRTGRLVLVTTAHELLPDKADAAWDDDD
jgi:hypothetical protein